MALSISATATNTLTRTIIMPSYKVSLPAGMPGLTLNNGHDTMIVEAATGAEAIALAQGYYNGPGGDVFAAATATEVTVAADLSPVVNDSGETISYKFTLAIAGGTVNETFEHTAVAAESYADVMTAMAVLLNAHASIAGAAVTSSTLFTVAAIADGIGDHTVTASFTLGESPAIPSFVGAITDGGAAGAALTIATLAAPVLPSFVGLKA